MTDQNDTLPTAPEAPAPEPKVLSFGALAALETKFSSKMSEGRQPRKIPRRTGKVLIPLSTCEPGTFDDDIEIGLEGLTSDQEFEAMKSATDGASAGYALAKQAMKTLNGAPLLARQRQLVWECLGFAGRALVMNGYLTQCTGAAEADLGKSLGVTPEG